MAPGILYVTMQPKPELSSEDFHDWYNNEHGANRLRLPFIQNGFRYRATDLQGPGQGKHEWMAIYDITDMNELNSKEYLALREGPIQTQRERDIRPKTEIDRRSFDFVREWKKDDYQKLEDVDAADEGNVLVAVSLSLNKDRKAEELDAWYDEEHVDMLSKVPGWRRTRRFVTSSIDPREEVEYLALHEYAPENGLDGPEFKAATSTPWNKEVMTNVVSEKRRRVFSLYYTFGGGPRHLHTTAEWDSPATKTRTYPASSSRPGAVESYITTQDGAHLSYRLEGSSDPNAPLIVLSNSILVTWGIWDSFVTSFLSSNPSNKSYRILRYHTRGRTSEIGNLPSGGITLDVLASDIIALLDALRVKKAALVAGVSLGGATVLNVGLKYPNRVERFLSCDSNAKCPATNSKVWKERVAMAEKEGAQAATSGDGKEEKIVGSELADVTVKRWNGGSMSTHDFERVKEMVRTNSLHGFSESVKALWEYDLEDLMGECKVEGRFLVGANDGVLPGTMKKMAEQLGRGTQCTVIEGAGHLPMVEKPEEFAAVVSEMLQSRR